ncbi:MAG: hypothetical protein HC800_17630 [Phormidesmis sp. RL_2_1]|nr:hypothetical protein [Phormidesmis sp. RL_2_1]
MSSAASRPPNSVGHSVGHSTESAVKKQTADTAQPSVSQPSVSTDANASSQATSKGLRKPPSRPHLIGPPSRPKPSAPPAVASEPPTPAAPEPPDTPQMIGPISPPSERMQYRAIGLIQGKYIASEEQFNRGSIAVADGTLIDAVLLGRVTSLIKKHIDLELDHLWVVYPRTLYNDENIPALHVQIVGVWEPETLNANLEKASESSADSADDGPQYLSTDEAAQQCDQFSIRGEIAKYAEEKSEIVVNIVQKSKSETAKPKRPFKLLISGQLKGRATGYFWELKVTREGGKLLLVEGTQIAVVPPKKKSKDTRKEGRRRTGGQI